LLDTNFLVWLLLGSPVLKRFPWLDRYRPWGLSPISLLELQLLLESGKLKGRTAGLLEAIHSDSRFLLDDPSLVALVDHALSVQWTRDPFDRLLAAHSAARRTPLCTTDRTILENHRWLVRELR
jgi:PIN domain nuclease of toxin-antitoxin system